MRLKLGRSVFIWLLVFPLVMSLQAQTNDKEEEGAREHPDAREEYWKMMHADEHGVIAPDALVNAKQELDRLRRAQAAEFGILKNGRLRSPYDGGLSGWQWLGPGNIGGRIRSILISPTAPNTMWAGGVAGGIWRTDNGGTSWFPVNDFMANLAVTSIVMDPTNNATMYAGTGEGFDNIDARRGAGIFKSIDGGVTWDQIPSTSSWRFVNRIAHHPTQTNTLLAAVIVNGNAKILHTSDGGTNWDTTLFAPVRDVRYSLTAANQVLAGGRPGMFTSTDGGSSWTTQTTGASGKLPSDGGRCEVACAPTNSQVYYVSMDRNSGEIYRSTDAGSTWTLQNTGSNYLSAQGWYANTIWVDPTDQNTIVVGGLDIWRSRNGGINLDHISSWPCFPNCVDIVHSAHADEHTIVSPPGFDGRGNKFVFVGNDGGIQFTPDIYAAGNGGTGDGWNNSINNLGITQFWGAAATSDGNLIVGGAQDNGQPHLVNQGGPFSWTSLYSFGDGGETAIDPSNSNRVYGEYAFLVIRRSDNGGGSYSDKINGLTDACNGGGPGCATSAFIAPLVLDVANSNTVYAGGTSIWQSVNNADAWSSIRPPLGNGELATAMASASAAGSPRLWVGYSKGTVSLGTFAGSSWTWANVGGGVLPANKAVTSFAVSSSNSAEAIVTFGGYDTNQIYMTTNLGTSWTKLRGTGIYTIPPVQVNSVTYNPQASDWIYIGTDLGVLASDDHGQRWRVTVLYPGSGNEGPANVPVQQLFWGNPNVLYAATHGRGMYRTAVLPNVYVDITNGGLQLGTQPFPFQFIQSAINTAGNGSNIIINPGDYRQAPLIFNKRGLVIAPSGGVVIH